MIGLVLVIGAVVIALTILSAKHGEQQGRDAERAATATAADEAKKKAEVIKESATKESTADAAKLAAELDRNHAEAERLRTGDSLGALLDEAKAERKKP